MMEVDDNLKKKNDASTYNSAGSHSSGQENSQ